MSLAGPLAAVLSFCVIVIFICSESVVTGKEIYSVLFLQVGLVMNSSWYQAHVSM
jgi:hypothetical protein